MNLHKPVYYDVEHLENMYIQMRHANDINMRDKFALERELKGCREAQAIIEEKAIKFKNERDQGDYLNKELKSRVDFQAEQHLKAARKLNVAIEHIKKECCCSGRLVEKDTVEKVQCVHCDALEKINEIE